MCFCRWISVEATTAAPALVHAQRGARCSMANHDGETVKGVGRAQTERGGSGRGESDGGQGAPLALHRSCHPRAP